MVTSYSKLVGSIFTLLMMVGLGRNVGLGLNMVRSGRLMVRRLVALQGVLGLKFNRQ